MSFLSLLGQALGLDLRGETLVHVFAVWECLRIFFQLLVSVSVPVVRMWKSLCADLHFCLACGLRTQCSQQSTLFPFSVWSSTSLFPFFFFFLVRGEGGSESCLHNHHHKEPNIIQLNNFSVLYHKSKHCKCFRNSHQLPRISDYQDGCSCIFKDLAGQRYGVCSTVHSFCCF